MVYEVLLVPLVYPFLSFLPCVLKTYVVLATKTLYELRELHPTLSHSVNIFLSYSLAESPFRIPVQFNVNYKYIYISVL